MLATARFIALSSLFFDFLAERTHRNYIATMPGRDALLLDASGVFNFESELFGRNISGALSSDYAFQSFEFGIISLSALRLNEILEDLPRLTDMTLATTRDLVSWNIPRIELAMILDQVTAQNG
jgi:hypothetical protein